MVDVDGGESREERAVWYVPTRCPHCDRKYPKVSGQDGRVRYHVCQDCGARFKSIEPDRDERSDVLPGRSPR